MSNPTHGGVYRIQNIDALALNVNKSNLLDGTTVINWPVEETMNENWKVKQLDNKTYKFETAIEGNTGQVLDENVILNCANICQANRGENQEWILEPVAFVIRNSKTGRVLQTAGQSNVVKTISDSAPGDRSVWWTFTQV